MKIILIAKYPISIPLGREGGRNEERVHKAA